MATGTIQSPVAFKQRDYRFTFSYSSGTIGTRGAQVTLGDADMPGYRIVSVEVVQYSSSTNYILIPFVSWISSSNTINLYVNAYRASTSAVSDNTGIVRVTWVRSDFNNVLDQVVVS